MESIETSQAAAALRDGLLAQPGFPADLALLDRFVREASVYGPLDDYKIFSPASRDIVARLRGEHGEAATRRFLRAAIAHGVVASLANQRYAGLPPRVKSQQLRQFGRMVLDTDPEADWLSFDSDLFRKEFGLAIVRLYAGGARLIDPRCGIQRSLLMRGSPRDWLRCAYTMGMAGGFRPYFQTHIHTFMLDGFTAEATAELYRCCADLYTLHPEALGSFAASWFYDPAVARVSPHLAYLREIPESGGAHMLLISSGPDAVGNAVSKSATRRRLYEAGEYEPKIYMIVWPKEKQKAWARANPG
ncbi:MAG: hypothetical protein AB1437_04820 [Pseudomonadota bacterium]